jgi:hypothetical protein
MIGSVARALGIFGRMKMGALFASVRIAAFVWLTFGSLIGLGVDRASAQTYSFDFVSTSSAPVGNILSFVATISGTGCSSTCVITSLSGTETLNGSVYSMSYLSPAFFQGDNKFNASTGVENCAVVTPDCGLNFQDSDGNFWQVSGNPGPGSGGTESAIVQCFQNNGNACNGGQGLNEMGTLTYGQSTPAPVPGAGLLSYLVLGFAGLMFGLKRLGWKTLTAVYRLSPKRAISNA